MKNSAKLFYAVIFLTVIFLAVFFINRGRVKEVNLKNSKTQGINGILSGIQEKSLLDCELIKGENKKKQCQDEAYYRYAINVNSQIGRAHV